jgi:phospholipase C
MQRSHSFDNYFGAYPGADGIPADVCMPLDPFGGEDGMCVRPFRIGNQSVSNLDHSDRTGELQYNHGRMDGFIYALRQRNQSGVQVMGYYDGKDLPYYWDLARQYVLCDRFFSSALKGSFANYMFWIAAASGGHKNRLPSDGYLSMDTIFDRLQERGITWKFYVEKYDPRFARRGIDVAVNQLSESIWIPVFTLDRFMDDPELFSHIVNLDEYFSDLRDGTLPEVAYILSSGAGEQPPGSLKSGQTFVQTVIQELMRSDAWEESAVLLTYDHWGGWYDHVMPPLVDADGYGFRVPALLVSPYARNGYIDHTEYDITSLLRFIEDNWELEPLTERDAKANSIIHAFDFTQPPRKPQFWSADQGPTVQNTSATTRTVIFLTYGLAILFTGLVLASRMGMMQELHRRHPSISLHLLREAWVRAFARLKQPTPGNGRISVWGESSGITTIISPQESLTPSTQAELKTYLLHQAEQLIDELLTQTTQTPQLEETVLKLRQQLDRQAQFALAVINQQATQRPVPGPICAKCQHEMHYQNVPMDVRVGPLSFAHGYYYCETCHTGFIPPSTSDSNGEHRLE